MATDLDLIIIIKGEIIEKIEYEKEIIEINEKINDYENIVKKIDNSKFNTKIFQKLLDSIEKYKITNYNLNEKRELIKNILIFKFNDKQNKIIELVNNILLKEFFNDLYERAINNIEFIFNYDNNPDYQQTKNYYENIRRNDLKYVEKLNAARYLYFRLIKKNNLNIITNYHEKSLEEILCYIRFYNNKY
jgi:hypothetical protein